MISYMVDDKGKVGKWPIVTKQNYSGTTTHSNPLLDKWKHNGNIKLTEEEYNKEIEKINNSPLLFDVEYECLNFFSNQSRQFIAKSILKWDADTTFYSRKNEETGELAIDLIKGIVKDRNSSYETSIPFISLVFKTDIVVCNC